MKESLNINIRNIQHVGIPVTNIKISEYFYNRLGFENIMESGFDTEDGNGKAVMMGRENIIIELYEMPETKLPEVRSRKDGHIDHIAFDVPDIDSAFKTLKQADFYIEDPEPVFIDFWGNGCRYFTMIGPDKERLEFNQIL